MSSPSKTTPGLALDLTGLFLAPINRTPRGIDRVELAYARHFLIRWPGECWMILPPPWGVRCFERERALRFLGAVEDLWREKIDPKYDGVYARTKGLIRGDLAASRSPSKPRNMSNFRVAWRFYHLLARMGFSFGRSAARVLPPNAIYLNVGQLQVFRPWFWWLKRRPDVVSVFMTHDVTPIEHPVHHPGIVVWLHHRVVRYTAEFARALIFPSQAACESTFIELRKYRAVGPAAHVELLPVPEEFLVKIEPDPDLSDTNYFIVLGSLDPHKNHLFLLEVWQQLIAVLGTNTPKLVIVGSPQFTSGPVFKMLQGDARLRSQIIFSTGLATPSLRSLIKSAKALIMPSISEGFGLPIVEALAQGTPVIASDILAHREAGRGGEVLFLPLSDKSKWVTAVSELAAEPLSARVSRPNNYRPKTWDDYFEGIENFLARVVAEKDAG